MAPGQQLKNNYGKNPLVRRSLSPEAFNVLDSMAGFLTCPPSEVFPSKRQ